MDYLLRDAYHSGVQYGHYDLGRVVHTLRLCADHETGGHYIGVEEDGIHAVEGLLIARFMMFTQLYFHKTRTIYDYHLTETLKELLKSTNSEFPPPSHIAEYLKWDDWRVLGAISAGEGGIHGDILRDRDHFRLVFTTAETMTDDEADRAKEIEAALVDYNSFQNYYAIAPGDGVDKIIERGRVFLEANKVAIDRVLNTFKGRYAKELELISTIAYLRRHAPKDEFENDEKLKARVQALKPKYGAQEIEKSIAEARGLLSTGNGAMQHLA